MDLTKKQIENSPRRDAHRPVSRRYEKQFYSYCNWPAYGGAPHMESLSAYPERGPVEWSGFPASTDGDDPHLRSTKDVTDRTIQAEDGEIRHVEDFILDDETWTIRYLIANTGNWWPGRSMREEFPLRATTKRNCIATRNARRIGRLSPLTPPSGKNDD